MSSFTYAHFNNRELSWLAFNERVLQEAEDVSNPLFERLKFLAIFSSNLDEFFMVRVAGLQDQVRVGFSNPESKSGLTAQQQLDAIAEKTQSLVMRQMKVYRELIEVEMPKSGLHIVNYTKLTTEQKKTHRSAI